jgi:catechol 2,3-dioxygenase-like lactoylglutathione lyase family enzyme
MRMHHVGIQVPDLEAAIGWYERALGARVSRRERYGDVDLAFLAVGGGCIELIQEPPDHPGSGVVSHVALAVDDLGRELPRLLSQGATLLEGPIAIFGGGRTAFLQGPHGEWLELLEPAG